MCTIVVSKQPSLAPIHLIIHSLSSHAWCCLSTSASVFLTFSSLHSHHQHSYSYVHLLFSYNFNLLSCIFLDISCTFVVPLIILFLILSTSPIHLNILISATSNFFSCARVFFTGHVSALYIIAGLNTVLHNMLFPYYVIVHCTIHSKLWMSYPM